MAYIMDFFAGIESKVLTALETSKIQYPAYVFVRDEEESTTGRLAFVDQNNVLKYIRGGEGKQYVVNVDVLPEEGDVEVLYICNGVVYLFDGEKFVSLGKDHTEELNALDTRVTALENADKSLVEQIEALNAKIEALEIPEECKCGAEYVITDVPEGTLVDYRDTEIRIMCPANVVFNKQNVGAGGDANCYYATFKTYAPNNDVAGYIEHLGNQVDAEVLNTFSTDEKGRKYQTTWLALARCDESGNWTYYGANSTADHYIGWDYRIDWYNADGVMIASDSIRINLSNENCHFVIEPYYITTLKAEVETIKEKNDDIATKLETITEQMTDVEERVTVVETEAMNFIELD